MSKNKNMRKRNKRKAVPSATRPGTLMKVNGTLQPVKFSSICDFCSKEIDHLPTRVAKPTGWHWEGDHLSYDVFYCCDALDCVESALSKLRKGLEQGIVVGGKPPTWLLPEEA